MRFNCGPTRAERAEQRIAAKSKWHRWFAWRPVRAANGQCVWLEWCLRKGTYTPDEYAFDDWSSILIYTWTWEYQVMGGPITTKE